MTQKIDNDGVELVRDMLSPDAAEAMLKPPEGSFAPEIGALSINNVFGPLWTRPGLSRRDRSLITLAALVASRSTHELQYHFRIALKNGVTKEELEETLYHLTGYVGFPPVATAVSIAKEIFDAGEGPEAGDLVK
jgi:4-carboxymuconolactone decarboxylase